MDNPVSTLAVFDDGAGPALCAGGSFQVAGGKLAFSVARWDGESWSALGQGLRGGIVAALAVFDDGSGPALYAGGSFETSGATTVRGIARWDGATWSEVGGGIAGGPSSKPAVSSFAVFDDGTGEALYVGGSFASAGETPGTAFIARWDGESWSPVGEGLGWTVSDLLVFDDGAGPALYATGVFERARGGPGDHVAKWDGQSWSDLGGGLNKRGMALAGFDDGRGPALYVAGIFTAAGGIPAGYIARWDGIAWSEVGGGVNDSLSALHVFDDGTGPGLYVGGGLTMAGGVPASGIARWNGQRWSSLGGGVGASPRPWVAAMTTYDDCDGPALHVAGEFLAAGGMSAEYIARWRCDFVACPADCDRSGDLSAFDFLCFQNLFAAMDPRADCHGDDAFTIFDFLCFQNAFAAGCW